MINKHPRSHSLVCLLAALASPSVANITFTQTVDTWRVNTYTWNAQIEGIVCERNAEKEGTVKSVWARVVQKNGSQAGTAVFCTTMRKTSSGLTDTWDVTIPAGMITDNDFWDATVLCVEIVKCGRASGRVAYNSVPDPFGHLTMVDLPAADLDLFPDTRYVSLDPLHWDALAVENAGFDMAVYAYFVDQLAPPMILNHVDDLALSTFIYDQTDAFGSGQPFDPNRLVILGIDLDQNWNQLPNFSDGLDSFQWQLDFGGGVLNTDQGPFAILDAQPLMQGWEQLCPADLNNDGELDFVDISQFVDDFGLQQPNGDFNGDGEHDFVDISFFVQLFTDGCNLK
jgi:hypothetical protein